MKNALKKMDLKSQEKKILFVFIFSVFFYTAFALFGDIRKILSVSYRFDWRVLPVLLFLSLLNYFFRFFRWHYLLKKIKVNLPYNKSFRIFLSGLSMTVTPGKMGEVVKAYLVKRETGNRFSEVVPLIVFERVTDGMAMILLALGGVYFFRQSILFFIFSSLLVLAFIFFILAKDFVISLIKRFEERFFHIKILDFAVNFFENANRLLTVKNMAVAVLFGLVAWAFEGVSLYLLVNQITPQLSGKELFLSFFIFSFSSIAGFLVMIPGGVGVAEGSITSFLMLFFKMSFAEAIFITLIFRFATLWFGVSMGSVFLIRTLNLLEASKK